MSLRSLKSGTIKKLRNGKALVTTPESPTIGTATNVVKDRPEISFTPSNKGVTATSFTVTSSPGSYTATGNTSPITYSQMGIPSGSYNFTVTGTASTGTGLASQITSLLQLDATYVLYQTFTSSGTFTVPAGCTKLAVFALGGGSGGNNGANNRSNQGPNNNYEINTHYTAAGSGGASSAISGFKDYAVSGGQTYSVQIGSGGNTASSGGTTNFGNLLSVGGNSVSGNASPRSTANSSGGAAGSNGGTYTARYFDGSTPTDGRGAGSVNNSPISISQNLTDLGSISVSGANGGGGGGAPRYNSNLGAGYGGGETENGGNASSYGQGGGGGGLKAYFNNNQEPTYGGAGASGVIYVYCGN